MRALARTIVFSRWALLSAIVACVLPVAAFSQDAKDLYNQAVVEGNSCKKMQLACQAAKLDPKKKDYSDLCDRYRTATNRSDEMFRVKTIDLINKKDLDGATRTMNSFVCGVEIKQSLQTQIADAQPKAAPTPAAPAAAPKDNSAESLADANAAFGSGRLDAAVTSAQQVSGALKPLAQDIINKVGAYHSAVAAAKQSEANKDYAGALNSWHQAQGISANGPDSPGSNISRLEPLAHPAAPTPTATPQQAAPVQVAKNTPPPPPQAAPKAPTAADINVQVLHLMDDAGKAEQTNNLQAAVRSYDAILRLQPQNVDATAKKAALMVKINSDPAEQAKSLTQAIRDFYASRYDDAADALHSYIDAPTAKSKGAAYFYLGATRLNRKIQSDSSRKIDDAIANSEVQRYFKSARAAGYRPIDRFVSPIVMRAWQNAQ